MSFKYYNERTGRYEPFTIPALKGERGERGIQGPKGDKGDKGDRGDQGVVFTPSVDANGNLSWTNNGGLTNPQSANIRGPQGPQGIQGIQGVKGDKGEKGDPGTASLAINDNVTNTASAWSGQKIAQELELKIGFRYLD